MTIAPVRMTQTGQDRCPIQPYGRVQGQPVPSPAPSSRVQDEEDSAGVRRQSACATLTLKAPPNVRVSAPETSEYVRRSVWNVKVRAPIHAECVHVDQRRRRLVEGHVRVKEDGARRREGVSCGLAQAL